MGGFSAKSAGMTYQKREARDLWHILTEQLFMPINFVATVAMRLFLKLMSEAQKMRLGGLVMKVRKAMIDNNLFRDLLRYGKIKADFEVKDTMGRYFRVRVFEYQEKKYFTVMCDGEPLRCEEV